MPGTCLQWDGPRGKIVAAGLLHGNKLISARVVPADIIKVTRPFAGIPADGKFTISEEEETAYKIRMGLYETPLVNKYKNNPFLEK